MLPSCNLFFFFCELQRTGQTKYVAGGRQREMEKGSGVSSGGFNSAVGVQGSEMLHSMLAAATPEQQKQILGEQLYPLVQKLKVMALQYSLSVSLVL